MSSQQSIDREPRGRSTLGIIGLFASAVMFVALRWDWYCGDASHDVVGHVPLGSRLSELSYRLPGWYEGKGEVVKWTPVAARGKADVENRFGRFRGRSLGPYEQWSAPAGERDRFTGSITFQDDSFTSDDVNEFVYVQGRLKDKHWGFLPG